MLRHSQALRDRARCSHPFSCWYRIEGRCCHTAITETATCPGQKPVVLLGLGVLRRDTVPGERP